MRMSRKSIHNSLRYVVLIVLGVSDCLYVLCLV